MSFAWIFSLIFLELMVVAWVDFKTEKIFNKWIFLNLGMSLVFYFLFSEVYPFSWEIFLFPIGFIVIGFFLYLLGVMGAGDSKFLASLFLLTPLEYHHLFFSKLIVSTIVTGLVLLTFRVILNASRIKAYLASYYWKGIKETIKSRFSYAPVILMAWILLGLEIWG